MAGLDDETTGVTLVIEQHFVDVPDRLAFTVDDTGAFAQHDVALVDARHLFGDDVAYGRRHEQGARAGVGVLAAATPVEHPLVTGSLDIDLPTCRHPERGASPDLQELFLNEGREFLGRSLADLEDDAVVISAGDQVDVDKATIMEFALVDDEIGERIGIGIDDQLIDVAQRFAIAAAHVSSEIDFQGLCHGPTPKSCSSACPSEGAGSLMPNHHISWQHQSRAMTLADTCTLVAGR